MSCEAFRIHVVSDDPREILAAEEHAAVCPECARILAGQERLRAATEKMAQLETGPPEHLEVSIRKAIHAEGGTSVQFSTRLPVERGRRRPRALLWWALAASFLLGIGLGVFQIPTGQTAPETTRRLLTATDLQIAAAEEESQLQSIQRLEIEAAPILARVSDISLASHRAGRLLEYRNQIATLDATIGEVRRFVERNPGHPRARAMLLDAYRQKKEILREVVALEERSS